MKVAASPRSMAQVAAVLAFVISHTTFLTAQDDEMGRCPKVVFSHQSLVTKATCCPSDDIECPEGLRVKGLGTSGTFGASRWTAGSSE